MNTKNIILVALALGSITLAAADTLSVTLPKNQRKYTGKEPMTFTLTLDAPADKASVNFSFRNLDMFLNGKTSIELKPSADKKVFTATIDKLENCSAPSMTRRAVQPSAYVGFTPVVTRGGKAVTGKKITPKFYFHLDQQVSDVFVAGIATQGDGKFGESFTSGSQITLGALQKFKFNPNKGTIEFFVFLPTTLSKKESILFFTQGGNPWSYHMISLLPNSRKISYVAYSYGSKANVVRMKKDFYADDFVHIMATWDIDANKMELFVDGKSIGTAPYTKPCGGNKGAATFGGRFHFVKNTVNIISPCQLALDEVRISGVVRKPEVPTKPYTVDKDTYVLLHFDGTEFLKDSVPDQK